jgi:hypothetical protein
MLILALAGIAQVDQPLGHIDEIVEGVGALVELAVEIPLIAKIVAAANMRDGIGKAAVEQRQPRWSKSPAPSPCHRRHSHRGAAAAAIARKSGGYTIDTGTCVPSRAGIISRSVA